MPYFLLVCAVVSLMLLGCSSTEERKDKAQGILDQAAESIVEGVEKAKSLKDTIAETASGASQKIQATAVDVEERANKIQNGVKKVTDATKELKEGAEEVKSALR